jgi:hypothetical protein
LSFFLSVCLSLSLSVSHLDCSLFAAGSHRLLPFSTWQSVDLSLSSLMMFMPYLN